MERLGRRDRLELLALQRAGLALAVSAALHAAVVWAAPARSGIAVQTILQARIVLPTPAMTPLPVAVRTRKPEPGRQTPPRQPAIMSLAHSTPDPHYYMVNELDVLPRPRGTMSLGDAVPAADVARLRVRIDASGRVVDVAELESASDSSFTAAAVKALKMTPFLAARRNGKPVRSEVVIELDTRPGRHS